ncbi:hypothetical protein RND81_14G100500 [Saponaria officinalis]|uniref:RING-type domain-containing protein n=1 Tax=Saponaria officinalis TaxID=3572 RepID=A0AAW1GNH0_SAPOF
MVDIYIPIAIVLALAFILAWCWTCRPSQAQVVVAVASMMGQELQPPPTAEPAVEVPKGLAQETIDSYPRVVIGESGRMIQPDDDTCPICLIEYHTKDVLKILPMCLHRFHVNCLDEWLVSNGSCPICRVDLPCLSTHVDP